MAIDPIRTAGEIQDRFRRYLRTTFAFPEEYADLREQFRLRLEDPGRLFRGPYLHGLAPYVRDASVAELVRRGVLPAPLARLPLVPADRPLYRHQVKAIERLKAGRNVIVSSGTGSGKTLSFLAPILASVLADPKPGVHALLLYPMNALVNDQLKNLRRILSGSAVTFGRYINSEVTPNKERDGRRLHPTAPANEVVSREVFRESPPHLLVTNYAMLEYLLLRADDSPLFAGPWRFVVVDEAHTYGGTKGGEVALLLRRLVARVKRAGQTPPQYIATSASLGTEDAGRREEVLKFARDLFNAPFDSADLIEAERDHAPVAGGTTPDPAVYVHPAVTAATEPGAKWTPGLSAALRAGGFPADGVRAAEALGATDVAAGLFRAFEHDTRVTKLRQVVEHPTDLPTAAVVVIGSDTPAAVNQLCGLVRVANKAKVPDGTAQLVPCRYHLFARGLSGAGVSLEPAEGMGRPTLHLEPTRETPDGRVVLDLFACRKCGQPYLRGRATETENGKVLRPGGRDDGDGWAWATWAKPGRRSDDETDEAAAADETFAEHAWNVTDGRYRALGTDSPTADEVRLWELPDADEELTGCRSCGGRNTVTEITADSDSAQAVLADAFYRCLPEAPPPPAGKPEPLQYPGRGRKLLTFADSRQSAAYFAPYLQSTNREQLDRWLVYQACRQAAKDGETDADTLIDRMTRLGTEVGLFLPNEPVQQKRKRCAMAAVKEFCVPFGRRESLEALTLIACRVELQRRWTPPPALLAFLSADELAGVAQVLLATVRQALAIELPDEVVPDDPAFRYAGGQHAMVAQGSETKAGRFVLHGFTPLVRPHLQRRSAYLHKVLTEAAERAGANSPADAELPALLDEIWKSLTTGAFPVLSRATLDRGTTGHRLKWQDLRLRTTGQWYICQHCRQWAADSVLGVCPSFRCGGRLMPADPEQELADHHYRRTFRGVGGDPVPMVAKEHTAQLGAQSATDYQSAFQDGYHEKEGQINLLSSSTTFELGVDLGDLEAVFLRNVPPTAANYQQRAGRAGRGAGTAAVAVTFVQSRSHDEHHFANPPRLIGGVVRPPRVELANEAIYVRHIVAVLIAEFVRLRADAGQEIRHVCHLFPDAPAVAPADDFLADLPAALQRNASTVRVLVPYAQPDHARLTDDIRKRVREAREFYDSEVKSYRDAIDKLREDELAARQANRMDVARAVSGRAYSLEGRLKDFREKDWVSFLSDRVVLPSYAFPIYNVSLDTAHRGLKLDRDLRLALTEYVPGAEVVADGRLWKSVGIKRPFTGQLEEKYYAKCKGCGHVMRHLEKERVFPDDICPVCSEPNPRRHLYRVPAYGFTTDLMTNGEELAFDKPHRIRSSQVLFDPQREENDPAACRIGYAARGLTVRTADRADFFVFNSGDEDDGRGFRLCKLCMRQLPKKEEGRGKNRKEVMVPHDTPFGRKCPGTGFDRVHLGHEFRSSAARLQFTGSGWGRGDQANWLSLLYAVLGGMVDALGVDAADVNGVIRPLPGGGGAAQEVVIFDDVPGGAGHCLRLAGEDELRRVLAAAHARVANCACGESASCYACLRSYRNQFCHDDLARGPVADYLAMLTQETDSEADRRYDLPDVGGALRAAIRSAARLDLIADRLDTDGPPEGGPWHLPMLETASRDSTRVRVAVKGWGDASAQPPAHLLALAQAGAEVLRVKPDAPPPPYALLALDRADAPDRRSVGFHWGELRTTTFDATTHRREAWHTRSAARLTAAAAELECWFTSHTEPLPFEALFRSRQGCQVHPFRRGAAVSFAELLSGLRGKHVTALVLQDPYLLQMHQMAALDRFLAAVPWADDGVSVRVVAQLADGDPRKPDQLTPSRQRSELTTRAQKVAGGNAVVDLRERRFTPLHMRFAHFRLTDGERLYVFERGLDIADPRSGTARADGYVLEFHPIPPELRRVLGVSK